MSSSSSSSSSFRNLVTDADCEPGSGNPLMRFVNQVIMPTGPAHVHKEFEEYSRRGDWPLSNSSSSSSSSSNVEDPFGVLVSAPPGQMMMMMPNITVPAPAALNMLHDALTRIADPRSHSERDLYFVSHCRELTAKLLSSPIGPRLLPPNALPPNALAFQHLLSSIPHMPPSELFGLLHTIDFQIQRSGEQQQQQQQQKRAAPSRAVADQWLTEFDATKPQQLDQQQIEEFESYYHPHRPHQHHQTAAQNWVAQFKQFTPPPAAVQLSQTELANMEQFYQESQRAQAWTEEFEQSIANDTKADDDWATEFEQQMQHETRIKGAKRVFGRRKNLEEKMHDSKFFKFMEQLQQQQQQTEPQSTQSQDWAEQYLEQNEATPDQQQEHDWSREFLDAWGMGSFGEQQQQQQQDQPQTTPPQWAEEYAKLMESMSGGDANAYKFEETGNNPYSDHPNAVAEGLELLQQGCLNEAILAFEAAVQQDPVDARAWGLLGMTQAENDNDPAAIPALQKSVNLYLAAANDGPVAHDAPVLEYLIALAASYTNEKWANMSNYNRALRAFEAWVRVHPHYRHIHSQVIGVPSLDEEIRLQWNGDPGPTQRQVMDMFIGAAQQNARANYIDADVNIGLGILHSLIEEYDQAAQSFHNALQKRPKDYRLWNKLGATLANNSHYMEAIDAYNHSLDININYVRARLNMGISHLGLGHHTEAANWFLGALSIQYSSGSKQSFDDTATWEKLRVVFSNMGRDDLIQKTYQKDLSLFEDEFNFV